MTHDIHAQRILILDFVHSSQQLTRGKIHQFLLLKF
jgi:hypothetical protein